MSGADQDGSERAAKIERLELQEFTAFSRLELDFVPGINVILGENGTGKTHLLKALYAVTRGHEEARKRLSGGAQPAEVVFHQHKLVSVFRPEEDRVWRLIRRPPEGKVAVLRCRVGGQWTEIRLGWDEKAFHSEDTVPQETCSTLFIPSREALALYEGFLAAYEDRELSFDETYRDLCLALSRSRLKGKRLQTVAPLLEPLHERIGGEAVLRGQRFYLRTRDGEVEAHLAAEGQRKLAALALLLANGSITPQTVLFWDEPEGNLNPALIRPLCDALLGIARMGTQVFLATHDLLVPQTLSLEAEYPSAETPPLRFFSLYREAMDQGVLAESAEAMEGLGHNAILDGFNAHYDLEFEKLATTSQVAEPPSGKRYR